MKDILSTLDSKDESEIAAGLKELIAQTYVIEHEYKELKSSYDALQGVINDIIARLPQAVWVLENGAVFVANDAANDELLAALLAQNEAEFELALDSEDYIIKREKFADKELIVATNITKQKRSERLQSMGAVAAQLAHEIRNPIGSLMLMCSALARHAEPKQQEIIADMSDAIARVEQIVKNTLQFSRGISANLALIKACELASECEQFEREGFSAEFEQAKINADKPLLMQALSNLIYNAFEAAPNGTVSVRGRASEDGYIISVEDSGEQIKESKRLFEAFYTTKLRGNGLGLAIAQQIAQAHGGELSYQNEPKAFIIKLPN